MGGCKGNKKEGGSDPPHRKKRHRHKKTNAQHSQDRKERLVELRGPNRYATDCLFYHEAFIFGRREGYCDMDHILALSCDRKSCSEYRSIFKPD